MIPEAIIHSVIEELIKAHGNDYSENITKCIKAVEFRWLESDGTEEEFQEFCLNNYVSDPHKKKKLFEKLQEKLEKMLGLAFEISWSNKWSLMMNTGPLTPVDTLMAEIDPFAHLNEDFFKSKIAHLILLNFPSLTLTEKNNLTNSSSDRLLWAQCRLAEKVQFRIPFHVTTKASSAINHSYQFLSHLIFDLERIIFKKEERLVNTPLKVDTHWGLRDQIVMLYQDESAFNKQLVLADMWEKATREEVPRLYYENINTTWDPITHSLYQNQNKMLASELPTFSGRYQALRQVFLAVTEEDHYTPEMPNYIDRSFEIGREMKEDNVKQLFEGFLTNPFLSVCADKLKSLLNRKLCSFDVVFNRFGSLKMDNQLDYDAVVSAQFPTLNHFHAAIPEILKKLGFDNQLANKISDQIQVATCRAGGFSSAAMKRGGKSILAIPTDDNKMNYTSFVTGMHELGHCVEGYLSLENIDYYSLAGVPSSAFSEAFAYLFDSKSLEILGINEKNDSKKLNLFWSGFLNCGIALVDMDCWHWMYEHPGFTENELKAAVINISKSIWNRYFSPIIGEKDSTILAGYNVMIANPLYLPEYALAIFIQSQIEDYLSDKVLGIEMPRMCKTGKINPNAWMMAAVGQSISYEPLLKGFSKAI